MIRFAPVCEFNTQFKGGIGSAHKGFFIYAQQFVESANRRNGCFTHTDNTDIFRLHQRYVDRLAN